MDAPAHQRCRHSHRGQLPARNTLLLLSRLIGEHFVGSSTPLTVLTEVGGGRPGRSNGIVRVVSASSVWNLRSSAAQMRGLEDGRGCSQSP